MGTTATELGSLNAVRVIGSRVSGLRGGTESPKTCEAGYHDGPQNQEASSLTLRPVPLAG